MIVGPDLGIPMPTGETKGAFKRLMGNRGFRNMWIGQTISGVGDWLVIGLLIAVVGTLAPGSSIAIAGIMVAKIVPSLLIGSVLGVLVDRFDRRRLMIACDVINGILCLGLVGASASSALTPGAALAIIYTVTFLMEICNLLFVPAKNALIPMIVEERDLASANGLSYTTQQVSMIIGLVASGAIVSVFAMFLKTIIAANVPILSAAVASQPGLIGPQGGIVLDSISFMFSAALVATIHVRRNQRTEKALDLRLIGKDVIESWKLLRDQKPLRGFLISVGFGILGGGALISVGLVYVQQSLVGGVPFLDLVPSLQRVAAQGPQTFMLVFLALGTFAGALLVPRFTKVLTLERLFVIGIAGFGLALLGFSTVGLYWVAGLFGAAAGFLLAQVTIAGNTYVAETVADEVRGRIFAALESIIRIGILASMLITAPLGDFLGSVVRSTFSTANGSAAGLYLTGSRITLIFASLVVVAAAVYASFAIDWRSDDPHRGASDE
jgi:dTMP kinase